MKTLVTCWALTAAYVLIAIVTFGYAAAHAQVRYDARCGPAEQRLVLSSNCDTLPVGVGLFAGLLWPLYWSWEFWDEKPQP